MNIKLNYLYRDGSNYKQHGSLIFANPNNLPIEKVQKTITSKLVDGEYFIAKDWNVPELFFNEVNEYDHEWHEFASLEETEEVDGETATIEKLLEVLI